MSWPRNGSARSRSRPWRRVCSPIATSPASRKGSRAAREGSFNRDLLTDANVANVRSLNEIAQRRGQTLAQMALAWTIRDPRVASALVGASSVEQLEDSLGALENLAFDVAELAEIDRFAVEGGVNLWATSSNA